MTMLAVVTGENSTLRSHHSCIGTAYRQSSGWIERSRLVSYLVRQSERQTRVRLTSKSMRAMVSAWPMAVHRQGECRMPAVNRQLGNGQKRAPVRLALSLLHWSAPSLLVR